MGNFFTNYILMKNRDEDCSIIRIVILVVYSAFSSMGYIAFCVDYLDKWFVLGRIIMAVSIQLFTGALFIKFVEKGKRQEVNLLINKFVVKKTYELYDELKRCKLMVNEINTEKHMCLTIITIVGGMIAYMLNNIGISNTMLVPVWAAINAAAIYTVIVTLNISYYEEIIIEIESIIDYRNCIS